MDKNELENGVRDLASRASIVFSNTARKVEALGKSSDIASAVKDMKVVADETSTNVKKVLNAMDALLAIKQEKQG